MDLISGKCLVSICYQKALTKSVNPDVPKRNGSNFLSGDPSSTPVLKRYCHPVFTWVGGGRRWNTLHAGLHLPRSFIAKYQTFSWKPQKPRTSKVAHVRVEGLFWAPEIGVQDREIGSSISAHMCKPKSYQYVNIKLNLDLKMFDSQLSSGIVEHVYLD